MHSIRGAFHHSPSAARKQVVDPKWMGPAKALLSARSDDQPPINPFSPLPGYGLDLV